MQCLACNYPLQEGDKFCSNCGQLHAQIRPQISPDIFSLNARIVSLFYLVTLIACLFVGKLDFFNAYEHLFWIEVFLAIWTMAFAILIARDMLPLYSFTNVRILPLLVITMLSILGSVFVSYTAGWLNENLFHVWYNYYSIYSGFDHSILMMYLSVAVYPAIFEELAFRGVLFHHINTVTGRRNTVIISSMAFAIIHISVISFYWLIPFALLLGYLRNRYNTLWYGMIAHFVFNATACTLDLLEWGSLGN